MDNKTKIGLARNKLESIFHSAGDNIIAGIIIANIFTNVENKTAIILIGGIIALLLYCSSFYLGIINTKNK